MALFSTTTHHCMATSNSLTMSTLFATTYGGDPYPSGITN